jgi:TolB-like protein
MKQLLFILAVLILGVSFLYSSAPKDKVIVVAPFKNTSMNRGLDYLTISIPEILTTYLSHIKGITIVERDQLDRVMEEKKLVLSGFGDSDNFSVIGKELNADSVLAGSFSTTGKYVRIDARLIDIAETKVLATYQVTAEIGPSLENQISGLAQKIRFSVSGEPFGILNVSTLDGAQVLLNGQIIGQSPLYDRYIEAGTHSLLISANGYEDSRSTFSLASNEVKNLSPVLNKLPKLFQISAGMQIDFGFFGYDNPSIESESGFGMQYINLEVFYKNLSLCLSYGSADYVYNLLITAPGGVHDTNKIKFASDCFQAVFRYYPLNGFISPFAGAGMCFQTLDFGDPTNSAPYSLKNQTRLEWMLETGCRVNFFDDKLSLIAAGKLKFPGTFDFNNKEFSIFGSEKFIPVEKKMEYFNVSLGISYNFF